MMMQQQSRPLQSFLSHLLFLEKKVGNPQILSLPSERLPRPLLAGLPPCVMELIRHTATIGAAPGSSGCSAMAGVVQWLESSVASDESLDSNNRFHSRLRLLEARIWQSILSLGLGRGVTGATLTQPRCVQQRHADSSVITRSVIGSTLFVQCTADAVPGWLASSERIRCW